MGKTGDTALTLLLAQLAAHDMLGFRVQGDARAQALAMVGSGKVGSGKPPPDNAPNA
jgi:hypothetical protein